MMKLSPITIAVLLLLLNLSIHHFKTQSLTSPQDISSLKSFISSISPSSILSWSCLASWNFSTADPCLFPSHPTHPRPGWLLRETHSANLPAHFPNHPRPLRRHPVFNFIALQPSIAEYPVEFVH
ncbi:hypothetical protein LINPERPRIM_LOCUS6490 [Linum perenne]